jgi:hypothetical protein
MSVGSGQGGGDAPRGKERAASASLEFEATAAPDASAASDATVNLTGPGAAPRLPQRRSNPALAGAVGQRYGLGGALGVGRDGRGARWPDDQLIHREVAVKRMISAQQPVTVGPSASCARRASRASSSTRRSSRSTTWASTSEGRPFFVMKRLAGVTLDARCSTVRSGMRRPARQTNRRACSRRSSDVCLRHRVRAPARRGAPRSQAKQHHPRRASARSTCSTGASPGSSATTPASPARWRPTPGPHGPDSQKPSWPDADLAGTTRAGSILGTPGYIPPEQLRGERRLDHRADVFALGCILFEILAGEALLPHGAPALEVDYAALDARPSRRAPGRELAPELDQICVVATRAERDQRYPTARALAEAVERYLDGDRDLALRRRLASEHVAAAQRAHDRGDDVEARRRAMSEAGRALALDPGAAEAAALVGRLMLEPPRVTPPEVQDELRALDAAVRREARRAIGTFGAYLLALPLLLWNGIDHPTIIAVIYAPDRRVRRGRVPHGASAHVVVGAAVGVVRPEHDAHRGAVDGARALRVRAGDRDRGGHLVRRLHAHAAGARPGDRGDGRHRRAVGARAAARAAHHHRGRRRCDAGALVRDAAVADRHHRAAAAARVLGSWSWRPRRRTAPRRPSGACGRSGRCRRGSCAS